VRRRGEPDPLPEDRDEVYQAAVTVMMRVVFLLFAEERSLLPQGELFTGGYGVSDELDTLDQRARDEGAEALDSSHLTWHRLLATSQALYRGASFEDIRLPSYGGSLFDPARFAFLTVRDSYDTLAVRVTDRVMLEVLRAAQMAELRGELARRVSFRDIDVEQIGYIYEGLLGYTAGDVDEVVVGLIGKKGEEPEIPLSVLEGFAASHGTGEALANAILTWVKNDQPAAVAPSKSSLAKAIKDSGLVEDADRALRAVAPGDEPLREQLRPFLGAIRRDLRGRPTVFLPGGLVVLETPSRATAGAHYTPKSLATEVVQHALEPLVYFPGPHQQVDGWVPVDSDRILELKVADIACGSGAFLVAAARYLADRLVEAWDREEAVIGLTPAELKTHAIRTVIATCLYGADINAMAVEMCKLSLWLVSLDPKLPFSFVDDKILHGNSLLGLTNVKQLKFQHIDPAAAHTQQTLGALDVDGILRQATRLRQQLASEVNNADPQRSVNTKRRQWNRFQEVTAELTDIADAVIAAGLKLGGKSGRALTVAYKELEEALGEAYPSGLFDNEPNRDKLDAILTEGLTPTVPTDYDRWKPLHWVIAVPDVMERGGFDAVIGNPPFLGDTKVATAMGTNVREWCVNVLGSGMKGKTDLVAYFLLRATSLLSPEGNLGLIATNTVAQGDTRKVSLKQMAKDDAFTITRCIQTRAWPVASVTLEFAAVWGTRGVVGRDVPRIADGLPVERISSMLEPGPDVDPLRLGENIGCAFEGCKPYGMGFVLEPGEAESWLEADSRNAEVLFRFLNGDDLNSRPDASASRWVIDFNDRSEDEARIYIRPFERVVERVKPERAKKSKAVREAPWWLFWRARPAMRKAIKGLDEVLVITRVSRTVMPFRVSVAQTFSESLDVFATDSYSIQAVLSSSPHQTWAIKYGSGMRNDPRYTPSDVFETFPLPVSIDPLIDVGRTLDTERREIMLRRQIGLTKLYNLVNDPDYTDDDIKRMREIHVELDQAVMDAYGWGDVELDHGFHTYRQMRRWTVKPAARVEILDRLLEENLRRAAAQGEAPPPADDEDEGEDE
jgi:methylase of polypeptide subunit release factors